MSLTDLLAATNTLLAGKTSQTSSDTAPAAARWWVADASSDPDWREYPPSLCTYLTHPDFLGLEIIGTYRIADHSMVAEGLRPAILVMMIDAWDQAVDSGLSYIEMWIEAGRGSGKSLFVILLHTYIVCRLLCLRDIPRYYGLAPGSPIILLNMSVNYKQSNGVIFDGIKNNLQLAPFFNRDGAGPNGERYRILEDEIEYYGTDVRSVCGHSDARAWRGFTILFGAGDEINFLQANKDYDAAEDVYDVMVGSTKSRFKRKGHPGPLFVGISSVNQKGDFMDRYLSRISPDDNSVFVRQLATWDSEGISVNAYVERDFGGWTEDGKIKNPGNWTLARFWREFGNVRPSSSSALYDQPERITACVTTSPPNFEAGSRPITRTNADGSKALYIGPELTKAEPQPGTYYYLFVDAGISRDSYGIALAHARRSVPTTYALDLVLELRPDHTRGLLVSEEAVTEFCLQLVSICRAHHSPIHAMGFDSWQTAGLAERMRPYIPIVETFAFSNPQQVKMHKELQRLIYNRLITIPASPILIEELERLQLLGQSPNEKVDHPYGGSKDVADPAAGAIHLASTYTYHLPDLPTTYASALDEDVATVPAMPPTPSAYGVGVIDLAGTAVARMPDRKKMNTIGTPRR